MVSPFVMPVFGKISFNIPSIQELVFFHLLLFSHLRCQYRRLPASGLTDIPSLGKIVRPPALKKHLNFKKVLFGICISTTQIAGWTNLNRGEVKHRCSEPSSADSQVNLLWRKMNTIDRMYFLNLPRQGCPNADWSSRQCHSSWSEILSKFTTLSVFHHLLVVF